MREAFALRILIFILLLWKSFQNIPKGSYGNSVRGPRFRGVSVRPHAHTP